MRKIICMFILAALAAISVQAEDWTVNGKDYHNVIVVQVENNRVHITYTGGVGAVALADLTPDLKKRFNYDPVKAKAADDANKKKQDEQAKQEALENLAKSVIAASLQARGKIIQVLPDGILAELSAHDTNDKGRLVGTGEWIQYDTSQYLGERVFVECDTAGLVDGVQWSGTIWKIGTFSYDNTLGARATIPKYTTLPASALKAYSGQ